MIKDQCVNCREFLTEYDIENGAPVFKNGIIIEKDETVDHELIYTLCHECTSNLETCTILMPPPITFLNNIADETEEALPMQWYDIKDIPAPKYDWIILGRYLEDEQDMVWQIGRFICNKFEFWNKKDHGGPYSNDSFWDFDPEQTTHWLRIPYYEKTVEKQGGIMEWISVKDRLPEKYERVLVTDGNQVCLHYKQSWCNFKGSEGEDLYPIDGGIIDPQGNWAKCCHIEEGKITHWAYVPLPTIIGRR